MMEHNSLCVPSLLGVKEIIGWLVQNNTSTAWLSLLVPTYDFNSNSIGHRGKITGFSYSQSDISSGCVVAHDHCDINQLRSLRAHFFDTSTLLRPQEALSVACLQQWLSFKKLCDLYFSFSFLLSLFHNKEKKIKDCQGMVEDFSMKLRHNLIKILENNLILHFKVG